MIGFSGLTDEVKDEEIQNESFYPGISVSHFHDCYRVPAEYELEMVKTHLKLAIAWANSQLETFKAEKEAEGITALVDIIAPMIGGETTKIIHYKHAVCCRAKGSLIHQYKTMVQAKGASSRIGDAVEAESQESLFYQYASAAIADLQGKISIMVEAL
ncbi:head completion/stabilization protein [Maridesulfovibrio ferrireducens]|uniref:head completion/stabilization protein n=1 Tax=Maridesulfovibrio ferrireducens TaxID=246191 RepID=UPI001A31C3E9|nr:head completion/stabilization protein [Maridesulfovibrio ferrireducens]MBI9109901.1 head completion/stabilization protein [Maridesulfovibrio ferrireducens]